MTTETTSTEMTSTETTTAETFDKITMFGADWCSDCRRSKKLLDGLGTDYDYIDLEATEGAADRARAISGRTQIPVVVFPDGAFFVEPSDRELQSKIDARVTRFS